MSGTRHAAARLLLVLLGLGALGAAPLLAGPADQGRIVDTLGGILPYRDRVEPINRMLRERLDDVLPGLMRETGIDLWLVINREYVEDPVYLTLVPEPVFAARRTTILLFHDRGPEQGVERLTVSRYPIRDFYEAAWEGGSLDEQWKRLGELIAERNPRRIGINTSREWPFGDGLSAALHERLRQALPPQQRKKLVSAEELCVRWLETRTASEIEVWGHVVALARRVIAEAFSSDVITPGATTTADVYWYIRQRFEDLDLRPWFQPYVNIQRRGEAYEPDDAFYGESDGVIRRGDVLHTDVGICYLRLCTDTQEMGYVLQVGEQDVPAGLQAALDTGNRWQDLLTAEFRAGRSGNDVLAAARASAEAAGIVASVYTHPLGSYGHAAGPTIGMWDNQGPTPGRGDWTLRPRTGYAIEGNVKVPVAEWDDQWVQIKLEQSAVFDGKRVVYLAGRQTRWHLIR
jgi:Xaa-Pro aminopeptidase